MFKEIKRCVAVSVLGAAVLAGPAQASYSNVVFFGDSISDTGNVLSLTNAFAQPPFPNFPGAPGRFSNGPAWTEYLASGLGFATSAKPSNLFFAGFGPGVIPIGPQGGQNFAFGGARTGLGGAAGPTTGLLGQLVAWDGTPALLGVGGLTRAADPNALYVVVAGANDLRDARDANPGGSLVDAAARAAAAVAIAQNVANVLAVLAQAGAQHFLISNLPDLGKTPEAVAFGVVAASTQLSNIFNAALAADAAGFDAFFQSATGIDLDIRTLDFHGLVENIYKDALTNGGAKYGITNITSPCIAPGPFSHQYFFPDATDINCAVSAFSDDLHPSGVVQRLLGQLALNTVPEPGSLALVLLGMALGLLRVGAKRRSVLAV